MNDYFRINFKCDNVTKEKSRRKNCDLTRKSVCQQKYHQILQKMPFSTKNYHISEKIVKVLEKLYFEKARMKKH